MFKMAGPIVMGSPPLIFGQSDKETDGPRND